MDKDRPTIPSVLLILSLALIAMIGQPLVWFMRAVGRAGVWATRFKMTTLPSTRPLAIRPSIG